MSEMTFFNQMCKEMQFIDSNLKRLAISRAIQNAWIYLSFSETFSNRMSCESSITDYLRVGIDDDHFVLRLCDLTKCSVSRVSSLVAIIRFCKQHEICFKLIFENYDAAHTEYYQIVDLLNILCPTWIGLTETDQPAPYAVLTDDLNKYLQKLDELPDTEAADAFKTFAVFVSTHAHNDDINECSGLLPSSIYLRECFPPRSIGILRSEIEHSFKQLKLHLFQCKFECVKEEFNCISDIMCNYLSIQSLHWVQTELQSISLAIVSNWKEKMHAWKDILHEKSPSQLNELLTEVERQYNILSQIKFGDAQLLTPAFLLINIQQRFDHHWRIVMNVNPVFRYSRMHNVYEHLSRMKTFLACLPQLQTHFSERCNQLMRICNNRTNILETRWASMGSNIAWNICDINPVMTFIAHTIYLTYLLDLFEHPHAGRAKFTLESVIADIGLVVQRSIKDKVSSIAYGFDTIQLCVEQLRKINLDDFQKQFMLFSHWLDRYRAEVLSQFDVFGKTDIQIGVHARSFLLMKYSSTIVSMQKWAVAVLSICHSLLNAKTKQFEDIFNSLKMIHMLCVYEPIKQNQEIMDGLAICCKLVQEQKSELIQSCEEIFNEKHLSNNQLSYLMDVLKTLNQNENKLASLQFLDALQQHIAQYELNICDPFELKKELLHVDLTQTKAILMIGGHLRAFNVVSDHPIFSTYVEKCAQIDKCLHQLYLNWKNAYDLKRIERKNMEYFYNVLEQYYQLMNAADPHILTMLAKSVKNPLEIILKAIAIRRELEETSAIDDTKTELDKTLDHLHCLDGCEKIVKAVQAIEVKLVKSNPFCLDINHFRGSIDSVAQCMKLIKQCLDRSDSYGFPHTLHIPDVWQMIKTHTLFQNTKCPQFESISHEKWNIIAQFLQTFGNHKMSRIRQLIGSLTKIKKNVPHYALTRDLNHLHFEILHLCTLITYGDKTTPTINIAPFFFDTHYSSVSVCDFLMIKFNHLAHHFGSVLGSIRDILHTQYPILMQITIAVSQLIDTLLDVELDVTEYESLSLQFDILWLQQDPFNYLLKHKKWKFIKRLFVRCTNRGTNIAVQVDQFKKHVQCLACTFNCTPVSQNLLMEVVHFIHHIGKHFTRLQFFVDIVPHSLKMDAYSINAQMAEEHFIDVCELNRPLPFVIEDVEVCINSLDKNLRERVQNLCASQKLAFASACDHISVCLLVLSEHSKLLTVAARSAVLMQLKWLVENCKQFLLCVKQDLDTCLRKNDWFGCRKTLEVCKQIQDSKVLTNMHKISKVIMFSSDELNALIEQTTHKEIQNEIWLFLQKIAVKCTKDLTTMENLKTTSVQSFKEMRTIKKQLLRQLRKMQSADHILDTTMYFPNQMSAFEKTIDHFVQTLIEVGRKLTNLINCDKPKVTDINEMLFLMLKYAGFGAIDMRISRQYTRMPQRYQKEVKHMAVLVCKAMRSRELDYAELVHNIIRLCKFGTNFKYFPSLGPTLQAIVSETFHEGKYLLSFQRKKNLIKELQKKNEVIADFVSDILMA